MTFIFLFSAFFEAESVNKMTFLHLWYTSRACACCPLVAIKNMYYSIPSCTVNWHTLGLSGGAHACGKCSVKTTIFLHTVCSEPGPFCKSLPLCPCASGCKKVDRNFFFTVLRISGRCWWWGAGVCAMLHSPGKKLGRMTLNIKARIKFPTFVSNNIKGEISAEAAAACCTSRRRSNCVVALSRRSIAVRTL